MTNSSDRSGLGLQRSAIVNRRLTHKLPEPLADFVMDRRLIARLLLVISLRCMSPAYASIEKCPADGAQAQECTGALCLQSMRISIEVPDVVKTRAQYSSSKHNVQLPQLPDKAL